MLTVGSWKTTPREHSRENAEDRGVGPVWSGGKACGKGAVVG